MSSHEWAKHEREGWSVCSRCGMVRNYDREQTTCSGALPKIRQRIEIERMPMATSLDVAAPETFGKLLARIRSEPVPLAPNGEADPTWHARVNARLAPHDVVAVFDGHSRELKLVPAGRKEGKR